VRGRLSHAEVTARTRDRIILCKEKGGESKDESRRQRTGRREEEMKGGSGRRRREKKGKERKRKRKRKRIQKRRGKRKERERERSREPAGGRRIPSLTFVIIYSFKLTKLLLLV